MNPAIQRSNHPRSPGWLPRIGLLSVLVLILANAHRSQAATAAIESLGVGTESLLGGDLTDPENDGDEAAGPEDPTWNWKTIDSNNEPGFEGGEFSYNVFDNMLGAGNAKWCCDDATIEDPKNITVEFAQKYRLTHFTVSSANDVPGRDPLNWQILGSNDGTTFEPIYTRESEESLWTERLEVVKFTLDTPSKGYTFFRFECTLTSDTLYQVGEIEYFGLPGGELLVEVLGTGTGALLGGDLTDPDNNGNEEAGPTDPSWNWKAITSNNEPGFGGGEFSFNIFDNLLGGGNDKWCCDDPTAQNPLDVTVEFARPLAVTHFTISSANDAADRDPIRFQILGSTDGQTFTPIYTRDNATSLWTDRLQVVKVTLAEPTPLYSFLRYQVTDTAGPLHQIGEIEYFGCYGGCGQPSVSGTSQSPESFILRITDGSDTTLDPASVLLSVNGQVVTTTLTKEGAVTSITYTPATLFPSGSTHEYELAARDNLGNVLSNSGRFNTQVYARLTASLKVTPDTTKPGFIWDVHQNGAFDNNDNVRPLSQLAGKLGVNFADKDAQGVAIAPGTPGANNRLPIRFEIETVINVDQAAGSNGDIQPDDQMPGIPGLGETQPDEGIVADILTFIELPAGKTTMIVNSDDGFRTTAGNVRDAIQAQVAGAFSGGRGAADTVFTVYVDEAGIYPFRTVWEEGGGGANIEWKIRKADATPVLINDSANGGPKAYRATTAGIPSAAVTRVTPTPNNQQTQPNTMIEAVIEDGPTPVDPATVQLAVDGATVTATATKSGNTTTISYNPPNDFSLASTHSARLTFGASEVRDWSFAIPAGPVTRDKVAAYAGFIIAGAKHTADSGGRTGQAGDYGMDFGTGVGTVNVTDISFVNPAAEDDTLTIAYFQKLALVQNSSAFWANSPGSGSSTRGFQAHTPWSDATIYFDTAGCCDADIERINLNIADFPGYSGDPVWWQDWHHFAFVKNATTKEIYVDGQLFHSGLGNPLPSDFSNMIIGGGPGVIDNRMAGFLDDFTVYNAALTAAQVASLASGTAPGAVTGNPGLLAHWDFNDPPGNNPTLSVARDGANIRVTYTGTLQSADTINGSWSDVAGATSPASVPTTAAQRYFRARN